ncbi:hypothetical protein [Amaricoccus macauensis]|uniref:hypothetical protein n=1 Tax=Amaricoccus macauensis TaxID=57001 RepID=UPI003C7A2962
MFDGLIPDLLQCMRLGVQRACLAIAAALLLGASAAQGQEAGLCPDILVLEDLRAEIAAASKARGPGPASSDIRLRLYEIGLGTPQVVLFREPDDPLAHVAVVMLDYARALDERGQLAARTVFSTVRSMTVFNDFEALRAQLGCRTQAEGLGRIERALDETDPTKGSTFLGSRRQADPYGFGHVTEAPTTVALPILLLLIVLAAAGYQVSRVMQARRQHYTCNVVVHVEGAAVPEDGTMLDVSRMEAKMICPYPPKPGTRIRLQWNRNWHEATVTWSNAHCAGMRFHEPIDSRTLATIRKLTDAHLAELRAEERAALAGPADPITHLSEAVNHRAASAARQ